MSVARLIGQPTSRDTRRPANEASFDLAVEAIPSGRLPDVTIHQGDAVSWKTSQGTTHGVAKEKRTARFQHDGQKFNASDDDPYWIVESDKSGATAAHKQSSLHKR